jgi:hypothetical protein
MGVINYIDTNFIVSSVSLELLSAGVYNKLDLTKVNRINDGIIDLKLSLESNLIPIEVETHVNEKDNGLTKNFTSHNVDVAFKSAFSIRVDAFLHYKALWDILESNSGTTKPEIIMAHKVYGNLSINMAGTKMSA